ncbi:hypothetical protein NDU88_002868 [Pleurodeles waltl]|uniref:Uncharacterized protein n=1 Tax=Pleurodeles waltl TaxID=8319 RepID=A0AAV7QAK2_PLEWA|nr:hypothetical protein NDU88_002868 [Pleurodeles waltl]
MAEPAVPARHNRIAVHVDDLLLFLQDTAGELEGASVMLVHFGPMLGLRRAYLTPGLIACPEIDSPPDPPERAQSQDM